jgi:hypothetical protein
MASREKNMGGYLKSLGCVPVGLENYVWFIDDFIIAVA